MTRVIPDIVKLVVCLAITFAVGFGGSLVTAPAIGTWYAALRKPVFAPPDWVFAPVWTLLYALMATAAFLVWRVGSANRYAAPALAAFAVQLGLNFLWTLLFFGGQQPLYALFDIVALLLMIAVTMVFFFKVSPTAGLLLIPYLAWVVCAAALNFELWRLNRPI